MKQPAKKNILEIGTKIHNTYFIQNLISQGSFGQVYEGIDADTKQKIAIKVEILHKNSNTLKQEHYILTQLQDIKGVPTLKWYGKEGEHQILVTNMFEKDLSVYMKIYRKFSLKSVIQIGIQIINTLEQVHSKGILHRDLKPENIVFSRDQSFYLIDFGISKLFKIDGKQLTFKKGKHFIGTNRYASIAAHKGQEQSPKDDLESLVYVLIFLYNGYLPWESYRVHSEIEQMKDSFSNKTLVFSDLLIQSYLRSLKYDSVPNYDKIKQNLMQVGKDNQLIMDSQFEWTRTKDNSCRSSLTIFRDIPQQIKPWIDDDLVNFGYELEELSYLDVKMSQLNLQPLLFKSQQ